MSDATVTRAANTNIETPYFHVPRTFLGIKLSTSCNYLPHNVDASRCLFHRVGNQGASG